MVAELAAMGMNSQGLNSQGQAVSLSSRAHRIFLMSVLLWLGLGNFGAGADMTWLYAVQISATVQTSPPQITLSWEPDVYGADSYTVYRKNEADRDWGNGLLLSGNVTRFTDTNVAAGAAYEYQVVKQAMLGYVGYGYIFAGIDAPAIENRGTVVLVVAADTVSLANELNTLRADLIGDGWSVIRHDISPQDSPASVQALIRSDYFADPQHVGAAFLFGHVPVVMSGDLNYDSHGAHALPADGFYGDMTGNWQLDLDPTNRPSYFPGEIRLMVGRVDFFDLPGQGSLSPWPNETELSRQYLAKDHAWRHKQITVPRRALMANRVGDYYGQAYAASGYRNFQPLVGPGNIVEADVSDAAPPEQRWISLATEGAWLWSYGCGGGQDNSISALGTHDLYDNVWSTDIVDEGAKVVFSMFLGSHFGDWTHTDNIMRSMLATPSVGLTACIVGLPHWFCHHLAMGQPIGYAARLTMNNTNLYQNQSNALPRAVFINLLGDPTLRMESVFPPSGLSASPAGGAVILSWSRSPDDVLGYSVYRSNQPDGPFVRLNDSLITGTSYLDSTAFSSATPTYMVRAIARQTNPSGSYLNPSQGIFAPMDLSQKSVLLHATLTPNGIQLIWNSQTNQAYHLEAKSLSDSTWLNISGPLSSTGSTITFVDTNSVSSQARLYRVVVE
jgi:hypothetical protein